MRILLLKAHLDASSVCDAIAAAYVEGARAGGQEIHVRALRALRFDLVLHGGYHFPWQGEADRRVPIPYAPVATAPA